MYMADDTDDEGQAWHVDRGENTRQNREQEHEKIKVKGYARADGTRVEGYRRRPPVRN